MVMPHFFMLYSLTLRINSAAIISHTYIVFIYYVVYICLNWILVLPTTASNLTLILNPKLLLVHAFCDLFNYSTYNCVNLFKIRYHVNSFNYSLSRSSNLELISYTVFSFFTNQIFYVFPLFSLFCFFQSETDNTINAMCPINIK